MWLFLVTQSKFIGNGDGTICDSMVVAAMSEELAKKVRPTKHDSWPDPEYVTALHIGKAHHKVKAGVVHSSWC